MLPPEEEALFENAFAPTPQMQELERRAFAAAQEMFGDNPQLVQQQVGSSVRKTCLFEAEKDEELDHKLLFCFLSLDSTGR